MFKKEIIDLLTAIEGIRKEMYQMAEQTKGLSDKKLIDKSQELDELLSRYNRFLEKQS